MGPAILNTLRDCLGDTPEFSRLARRAQGRSGALCVDGVSGAGKAALVAGLLEDPEASALIATYNGERAQAFCDDLKAFMDDVGAAKGAERVLLYPSIASALYDGVQPDRMAVAQRLTVLERLCAGTPTVIIASITQCPVAIVSNLQSPRSG